MTAVGATPDLVGPVRSGALSRFHGFYGYVRRDPFLAANMVVLVVLVVLAIGAPVIGGHSPDATDTASRLSSPGGGHLLGTDALGRDVWSRTLFGMRTSLRVGGTVALGVAITGTLLGLLGGYFPRFGALIMRAVDAIMAVPALLFAVVIVAIVGAGIGSISLSLVIALAPRVVRTVFAETRALKERDHVGAAKALGCSSTRVLRRHVLPGAIPAAVVEVTNVFALSMVVEASLSVIGAGIPPPTASLGRAINENTIYIDTYPLLVWAPAVAIVLLVLPAGFMSSRIVESMNRGDM